MNRLAVFERSPDQAALKQAAELITGGQSIQTVGGCAPQAAHHLLAWTDIPVKTLQEGTDPEGGGFIIAERQPHDRRVIVRGLLDICSDLNSPDLTLALEFINQENSLLEAEAALLIPFLQKQLFSGDQQIRYLARKARDHLIQRFPEVEKKLEADSGAEGGMDATTTREILLQKMRLGSRFVCFDAIERLTDSGDPTLVEPLLQFLDQETDPFKVAHLVKCVPRLKDPRIAKILRAYLSHPDQRVVANAIEGFWYIKAPELLDEFSHLAESPDNRVRANAIKALFPFDAPRATDFLRSMLQHHLVSMQDSAVSLLKDLPWQDIQSLAEMAFDSRYTTVRLKALELLENKGIKPNLSQHDHHYTLDAKRRHEHQSLGITLALAFVAVLARQLGFNPLVGWLMLGGMLSIILTGYRPTWGSFPRIVLSWVFLAALFAGAPPLPTYLGILAVWINEFGMGFLGRDAGPRFAAWGVATFAILFLSFFGGDIYPPLDAIVSLKGHGVLLKQPLQDFIAQYQRFSGMFLVFFSIAVMALLNLEWLYPLAAERQKRNKYFLIGFGVCIFAIVGLHALFAFSLKVFQVAVRASGPAGLLKLLGE